MTDPAPSVGAGAPGSLRSLALDEVPAIDALRDLLGKQLRAIERTAPGAREGLDPEELHRFRVATRRSRALMRAARPLIRDQLAVLDRELRWLGGVTGPIRDLDVMIDHLRELADDLGPDQAGATLIVAALERDRLAQRETLVRALDSERFHALVERFTAALPELSAVHHGVDLARLARRELERVRKAYAALGFDPPDDELHALRIKAKRARYAVELAATGDGHPLAELARAITELQDVVGAHQDAVVAERRVRALATEDTALAVGRIVERERIRRRQARERIPATWERIERVAAQAA